MENTVIDENRPVFPISSMAKELNVCSRTLRIYDEENILSPRRSKEGRYGRRLYTFKDLIKGRFISFLTNSLGMSIIGIKVTLILLNRLKVPSDKYMEYLDLLCNDNGIVYKKLESIQTPEEDI